MLETLLRNNTEFLIGQLGWVFSGTFSGFSPKTQRKPSENPAKTQRIQFSPKTQRKPTENPATARCGRRAWAASHRLLLRPESKRGAVGATACYTAVPRHPHPARGTTNRPKAMPSAFRKIGEQRTQPPSGEITIIGSSGSPVYSAGVRAQVVAGPAAASAGSPASARAGHRRLPADAGVPVPHAALHARGVGLLAAAGALAVPLAPVAPRRVRWAAVALVEGGAAAGSGRGGRGGLARHPLVRGPGAEAEIVGGGLGGG